MAKRQARFSAVWPISRLTTGSVNPLTMPITGANKAPGRNLANSASRAPSVCAWAMRENHSTILSL